MFCGILVLLAAFYVYSSEDILFTATTQKADLWNSIKHGMVTKIPAINKRMMNRQYIVDLYKALSSGPKTLPFGAQFVRSFQGNGKTNIVHFSLIKDVNANM